MVPGLAQPLDDLNLPFGIHGGGEDDLLEELGINGLGTGEGKQHPRRWALSACNLQKSAGPDKLALSGENVTIP